MSTAPIVYKSKHRVRFSELDAYNHVSTANYATYYVDHRMDCLRDSIGWSQKALGMMSFMVWMRKIEIDYVRPVRGDQEITISSSVREFRGPDALIDCAMIDENGKTVSRCIMTVAHVDKASNRATEWPAELRALFYEKVAVEGA